MPLYVQMWWAALFVTVTSGERVERPLFMITPTLTHAAAQRKHTHKLAQAIEFETRQEAEAFAHLLLTTPKACRAPLSFASKAEALGTFYSAHIFTDFSTLFATDTLHEFVTTTPHHVQELFQKVRQKREQQARAASALPPVPQQALAEVAELLVPSTELDVVCVPLEYMVPISEDPGPDCLPRDRQQTQPQTLDTHDTPQF